MEGEEKSMAGTARQSSSEEESWLLSRIDRGEH